MHGIRELPLCHGPESFAPLSRMQGQWAFTVGGCASIAFQSGRTCTVWVPERLAGRRAPSVPDHVLRALPHTSCGLYSLRTLSIPAHPVRLGGVTPSGSSDAIRVAVSTVIFSVRSGTAGDRLMLPLVRRTREPHPGSMGTAGRMAGSCREPGRRGIPPPSRRRPRSCRATLSSCTPSATSTAPPRARSRSSTGHCCDPTWSTPTAPPPARPRMSSGSTSTRCPPLAFDHNRIAEYALWRLRNKVGYSWIGAGLLPDEFTLTELREVYETVLGRRLDPSNFRRLLEGSDELEPTESFRTGKHRPARLFRLAPAD